MFIWVFLNVSATGEGWLESFKIAEAARRSSSRMVLLQACGACISIRIEPGDVAGIVREACFPSFDNGGVWHFLERRVSRMMRFFIRIIPGGVVTANHGPPG